MTRTTTFLAVLPLLTACGATTQETPATTNTETLGSEDPAERLPAPNTTSAAMDCEGREVIFRCTAPDDRSAELCLDSESKRIHGFVDGATGRQSFAQPVGADTTGHCSFTSPHMSHEAAYVGTDEARLIVRSTFVNPDATEFHEGDPEGMPDAPTWRVFVVDGLSREELECSAVAASALDRLAVEGARVSRQQGCEDFGD